MEAHIGLEEEAAAAAERQRREVERHEDKWEPIN